MIDGVTGGPRLPETVREQIIAHADGVPLFVEELTKTVLESSTIHSEDDRPIIELRPTVVVPSSLHASLMARLDRLAGVKDVAQMGSVIGREFSFQLFQSVFALPGERLSGSLRALVAADLIVEHGRPPNAVYSFRHALVQDAAYSSLLRDRRRALHLQVATDSSATKATWPRRSRSCWHTISPKRVSQTVRSIITSRQRNTRWRDVPSRKWSAICAAVSAC